MEKTSIINKRGSARKWDGPNGTMYFFELEMENGDKGGIGSKSENPQEYSEGKELTYTLETTDKGNKIKAVNKNGYQSNGFAGKPKADPKVQMASFALSYSKDLVVAGKVEAKDILLSADKFYEWLQKKSA